MRNPVVDVVVIGAMKCGTTALYHFFKRAGSLSVNRRKEVDFFIKPFDDASLKGYDGSFLPGNVRIDVSPNYSKCHQYSVDIPALIATVNPNAKLIFLVRDPIQRIQSHLYHNVLHDRVNKKEINNIKYLEHYILTSSYSYQLAVYLKRFNKENICVIQQELMIAKPDEVIGKLSLFLETGLDHVPFEIRFSADDRYMIPKHDLARRLLGSYLFSKVYNRICAGLNIKPAKPVLNDEIMNDIRKIMADDINKFCTLYSIDKSLWKTFFPDVGGRVLETD